ncbi:MAG TPA: 2-dehydropantoate 2-reductase N-terminal domain-containing protein [Candidatus Baltobacteraceae bacterium]|nr:2-dehydropantoate 2-reductase N-terminal domain-containing protein [Candidatus Baltobacteraceae bacterium]
MNILVVGAGAVGTFLGERFAAVGAGVTFAPRELDAVHPGAYELAIVAVKSYDTDGAIATLRRAALSPETTILTVQNGIGNEERLIEAFGNDRVIAGALTIPVERDASGKVRATARGGIGLAPCGSGSHNWLSAACEHAGIAVATYRDYRALKWSKLVLNILANAQCAILDILPDELMRISGGFTRERLALRESLAVMRAQGIAPVDLPEYRVRTLELIASFPEAVARTILASRLARSRGGKAPSLLHDVRAGNRRTEIASLNGAVAQAAQRFGVKAPVNAAFSRLIDEIVADSARREVYRRNPKALEAAINGAVRSK